MRPGTPSWVDLGSPDVDASHQLLRRPLRLVRIRARAARGRRLPVLPAGRQDGRRHRAADDGGPAARVAELRVGRRRRRDRRGRHAQRRRHVPRRADGRDGRRAHVDHGGSDGRRARALAAAPAHGAEIVNEPVSLSLERTRTRATRQAAKPFYKAIFGWQGDTAQMGDIEYTTWQLDGKPVGGMIAMSGRKYRTAGPSNVARLLRG